MEIALIRCHLDVLCLVTSLFSEINCCWLSIGNYRWVPGYIMLATSTGKNRLRMSFSLVRLPYFPRTYVRLVLIFEDKTFARYEKFRGQKKLLVFMLAIIL